VTKLNKKILLLLIATVSVLMVASLVNAQPSQPLTVWTDKQEYGSGETGTLSFVFVNLMGKAVTIKKITFVYEEWSAYRDNQWEGNQTMEVNQAIIAKGVYANSTKFTVPSDGRAKTTAVFITIQTEEFGDLHYSFSPVSVLQSSRYMDQIVMLFTVQILAIGIAAAAIAITIFLSARRPSVVWKTEEESK